ncbi:unnamed protein product [Rotaria sordida]|uniref:Tetraspanin n=2 Tax=Rotaria sordida TaxID=392033 RepID=A0A819CA40_9BILA|nr:unnamed protein product [Rotaria sordida]CAF3808418.1 unnamed protein product [Rotaria sordida]
MACCINVTCLFCTLCVFIGLVSLIQLGLGICLTFLQPDIATINRLVKTDQFDSYLLYILFVFIGLGLISLVLSFFSIYSTVRRLKSLSLFVTVLWVFAAALNIVMLIVLFLYYFAILPQLRLLLLRTLQQTPLSTSYLIDPLQSKYHCCGINDKDDYKNLSLDPFPSSCCRVPNCWRDTDINNNNGSNSTISLMHTKGCYPVIDKYVTIELLILMGTASFCALLQALAIILMCTLYQRYKKLNDDDPKFIINHLTTNGKSMNNSNDNIQGSSKTIEETVEITQI